MRIVESIAQLKLPHLFSNQTSERRSKLSVNRRSLGDASREDVHILHDAKNRTTAMKSLRSRWNRNIILNELCVGVEGAVAVASSENISNFRSDEAQRRGRKTASLQPLAVARDTVLTCALNIDSHQIHAVRSVLRAEEEVLDSIDDMRVERLTLSVEHANNKRVDSSLSWDGTSVEVRD